MQPARKQNYCNDSQIRLQKIRGNKRHCPVQPHGTKRSHVYFHGDEGCNGIQCHVESTEFKEIQAADHLLYDLAGRAQSCF